MLIESQYFPPISTFSLLKGFEIICIDIHSYYVKGSYRNRCVITGPNGPIRLSIPLIKGKHQKLPLGEVEISFTENWKKDHWQSIISSYNRSPYFNYYEEELFSIFFNDESNLVKWNQAFFSWILDQLRWKKNIIYSKGYMDVGSISNDYRNKITPHVLTRKQIEYEQVFSDRNEFMQDLSILDLLFSKGPQANEYI